MSAAAMVALAVSAGMPALGQQHKLAERPNMPGERLRPPPLKRKTQKTADDLARIAAAEAKRARKRERNARLQAAGAFL